jgi:hypothetical protein
MPARPWFEGIGYDLRFAWRGLQRDRGFAIIAVATMTRVK